MDEMWVDWQLKGGQEHRITRGCSNTEAITNCPNGATENIKYKQCFLSCTGDMCNNDLSVGDKFIGDYKETSCHSCKFIQSDSGDVLGNENCPESGGGDAMECPNYATAGCYTGASTHDFEGERMDEVYEGCSSFEIESGFEEHEVVSDVTWVITKTFCQGENCNPEHVVPGDGVAPPPGGGNGTMCHVCGVTVDQFNVTIGIGQTGCWDGGDEYLSECESGSWCSTDLEIDWYSKGHYSYRLSRGCSAVERNSCFESQSQYKDCAVTCDPAQDGEGCNSGLDAVGDLFDQGNELECFNCQYARDVEGEIENGSNENCKNEDVTGNVDTIVCPKYANAACYMAATWHKEDKDDIQEDHKGCSTFKDLPSGSDKYCQEFTMGSTPLPYSSCKEICEKSSCNNYSPSNDGSGGNEGGSGDGNSDNSVAVTFMSLFALLPMYFLL